MCKNSIQVFRASKFQSFTVSKFQSFKASTFQSFKVSKLPSSIFQSFKLSEIQTFEVPKFQSCKVSTKTRNITFVFLDRYRSHIQDSQEFIRRTIFRISRPRLFIFKKKSQFRDFPTGLGNFLALFDIVWCLPKKLVVGVMVTSTRSENHEN